LVVERLTGTKQDSFANPAMEWGTQQEPSARDAYSFISGYEVSEIGFVDHPEIAMAGASPDGLIAQDGLVEIKCPNTATHIDWMLSGNVPKEHELQILFQMDCTGRKWCDFVSYDPRLPIDLQLFVVRMEFDKNRALEIKESVKQFIAEVDKTVSDLLSISQQEEI
jgi:putative phage-type endonuclease